PLPRARIGSLDSRLKAIQAGGHESTVAILMKILLVEDDSNDADFLQACLRRQKARAIDVVRVDSMMDAVSALKQAEFDVILLDLNLPDSTGQESVHRIKCTDPTIPIVVLSGEGSEEFA